MAKCLLIKLCFSLPFLGVVIGVSKTPHVQRNQVQHVGSTRIKFGWISMKKYPQSILNITPFHAEKVDGANNCGILCLLNTTCHSVNLISTMNNGTYLCELLKEDKYGNYCLFRKQANSTHYAISNECARNESICANESKVCIPDYSGTSYTCKRKEEIENCPVPDACGSWGVWSECSKTCGNGTAKRTRQCRPASEEQYQSTAGTVASGHNQTETRKCNSHICSVPHVDFSCTFETENFEPTDCGMNFQDSPWYLSKKSAIQIEDYGPFVDHTYGNGSGCYMYFESIDANLYQSSKTFISLDNQQPFTGNRCLTFWLSHQPHRQVDESDYSGSFSIIQVSKTLREILLKQSQKLFSDIWVLKEVSLIETAEKYQIVFYASVNSGDTGIDDIRIYPTACSDI